jgi:predicted transcriptional regulator
METDKIHERVIEIQNNIQISSPEQQTAMMVELINMVSKIEQSLSDIKVDIDDIENQIQTNEE